MATRNFVPRNDGEGNLGTTLKRWLSVAMQYLSFPNNINKPSHEEGTVFYDKDEHALAVYNDISDVTHQLGQESYVRVFNNSGSTILNGKVVYISGGELVEGRPTIELAIATNSNTSRVIGLATHDIPTNSYGYVTGFGLVNDVDTSSFSSGDVLFLSGTIAGDLQNTPPSSPDLEIQIGFCVLSDISSGKVLVELNADLGVAGDEAQTLILDVIKGTRRGCIPYRI
jgi:hypothetical protein